MLSVLTGWIKRPWLSVEQGQFYSIDVPGAIATYPNAIGNNGSVVGSLSTHQIKQQLFCTRMEHTRKLIFRFHPERSLFGRL
jgi:hypothetical protein